MKKRILGVLFCSMFLLGASITVVKSVEAKEEASIADADSTYVCTVNPNAELNTGKCRAVATGQSMCFRSGSGPACHGTLRY